MNAGASSTTTGPLCRQLDAEELAAFLERRLPDERCRLVRAHLAVCEDCYQVFSEVLETLVPDEPREKGADILFPAAAGKVVRGRLPSDGVAAAGKVVRGWLPRGSSLAWVGVAAAAVVCLAAGLFLAPSPQSPQLAVADLAGGLSGTLREGRLTEESFWATRSRGVPDHSPETETPLRVGSFRLGVALLDLDLCLEERDWSAAQGPTARVYSLARDLAPPEVSEFYRGLGGVLQKGDPDPLILAKARKMADSGFGDSVEEFYLGLGEWTETGRLAVLSRRRWFFEQGKPGRFLDAARKQLDQEYASLAGASDVEKDRVARTRVALGEIARAWRGDDPSRLKAFEHLLEIYDPHGGSASQADPLEPPAR